ncbi:hypothetical protein PP707_08390 [Acetobacter pasteurianus]|nr:hypothetical protein [Acetobacter pasteurianus]
MTRNSTVNYAAIHLIDPDADPDAISDVTSVAASRMTISQTQP